MKTLRLFALLMLASSMSTAASAAPITLNAGDSVLISWDFTGLSPAPPYDKVNVRLRPLARLQSDLAGVRVRQLGRHRPPVQPLGFNQGLGSLTEPGLVDGQFSLLFKLQSGSTWADFSAIGSIDNGDGSFTSAPRLAPASITFVPEPATLSLLAFGAIGVAARRWRMRAA